MEIHIEKMADIAALTPDQFERFLPDFKLWYQYVSKPEFREIKDVLAVTGMAWVDDGKNDMLGMNVEVVVQE